MHPYYDLLHRTSHRNTPDSTPSVMSDIDSHSTLSDESDNDDVPLVGLQGSFSTLDNDQEHLFVLHINIADTGQVLVVSFQDFALGAIVVMFQYATMNNQGDLIPLDQEFIPPPAQIFYITRQHLPQVWIPVPIDNDEIVLPANRTYQFFVKDRFWEQWGPQNQVYRNATPSA